MRERTCDFVVHLDLLGLRLEAHRPRSGTRSTARARARRSRPASGTRSASSRNAALLRALELASTFHGLNLRRGLAINLQTSRNNPK